MFMFALFIIFYKVDIDAVDTHRPKLKKSASIRKLGALNLGASGEIVKEPMSPIIPISPNLFPKTPSKKEPSTLQLGEAALPP
jgi:6-phosphofructo-2-kinase/fructose-2,6-biphosphatase 2